MKGTVLGKEIIGMQPIDRIEISDMTITFVVDGKRLTEEVIEVPSRLKINSDKLNINTLSGKKVCLKPESKNEVEALISAFRLKGDKKEKHVSEMCN